MVERSFFAISREGTLAKYTESFKSQEAEIEMKKTVITLIATNGYKGGILTLIDIEHFGSLGKLIRVTALVLSFY